MKRFLRIALIVILFLGGGALLTWYLIMRRTVPEHARCIPKDALAVLTLNVRELALDYASGGHLFPEMANEDPIPTSLKSLLKAIEKNDGSGLKERADLLGFFYQENDEAYIGICAAMDDSSKLNKIVTDELSKKYPVSRELIRGGSLVHFDSTSAVLGWNSELAIFIIPFSNHGGEKSVRQCERLLSQKKEASVLMNSNFCEHEKSAFDAGLWIQAKPFLRFTNGGQLFRTALNEIDYISLAIDFKEGETDIQRIITSSKQQDLLTTNSSSFCCEPKQIEGFWNLPLDLKNDSLKEAYAASPPLDALPFNDDEILQLLPLLDGNCTVMLHDTISYDAEYITYEYDEEFNQKEIKATERKKTSAATYSFGISDEAKTNSLIENLLEADSIPKSNEQWLYTENGIPMRMMIRDKRLILTSWPKCDGKTRAVPEQWQMVDLYFEPGDYLRKNENGILNFFTAGFDGVIDLLGENLAATTISKPSMLRNIRSSNIHIRMKNQEINSLIQLGEIVKKGLKN